MAAATITNTSYGFKCTGGTDETAVTTMRCKLKRLVLIPANADETATFKDNFARTQFHAMKGAVAATSYTDDLEGSWVNGIRVTLSGASAVVEIHVE